MCTYEIDSHGLRRTSPKGTRNNVFDRHHCERMSIAFPPAQFATQSCPTCPRIHLTTNWRKPSNLRMNTEHKVVHRETRHPFPPSPMTFFRVCSLRFNLPRVITSPLSLLCKSPPIPYLFLVQIFGAEYSACSTASFWAGDGYCDSGEIDQEVWVVALTSGLFRTSYNPSREGSRHPLRKRPGLCLSDGPEWGEKETAKAPGAHNLETHEVRAPTRRQQRSDLFFSITTRFVPFRH